MTHKPKNLLHINLPTDLLDAFDLKCLEHNKARSDMLRSMLSKHDDVELVGHAVRHQLTITVEPQLLAAIQKKAKALDMSLSEAVRQIIQHHTK